MIKMVGRRQRKTYCLQFHEFCLKPIHEEQQADVLFYALRSGRKVHLILKVTRGHLRAGGLFYFFFNCSEVNQNYDEEALVDSAAAFRFQYIKGEAKDFFFQFRLSVFLD